MSGIACASDAGVAAPPLSCGVEIVGGSSPFSVVAASGDLYTNSHEVISVTATGGTPPYTLGLSIQGDPSGKLSLIASSDGVHETVAWTGFSVNETESGYVQINVTDSVGATASDRFPTTGTFSIKRVA
jgi:hypothetical protein